jgi:4-hydroxy-tetrahydrodipicolinate reductase
MKNIVVTGAKGRMGKKIIELIGKEDDLRLAGEVDVGDDLSSVIGNADVVIDFSTPDTSEQNARIAASAGKPIVIGTTGLNDEQKKSLSLAAISIAMVFAPNMSIGVNTMFGLIGFAARSLKDVRRTEISETHHIHKKDRPSGTALGMLSYLSKAMEIDPDRDVKICEEEDDASGNVVVRSFRRGEVAGDHEIKFFCPEETLTIEHHAEDRTIFARGAIVAARWVVDQPTGLYDMQDVLGFK